ncbi:hypothetical protein [Ignavibacterium sp.]|uniref:DUF6992 family protein n=1 Tax=Ignavibacterium sp. TaxID=2651167 RepID=UPI002208DD2C|nr:hypothetical protein [Ignavibacterium sp.]BDQ03582.1 MAG: hypothetical protein KatS3mg037_2157 [Ignavibacterium sp.]
MNILFYISIFLFFFTLSANPQSDSLLKDFHLERMNINESAMLVLGGWVVGNILVGTYGNFKASGEAKYFHQFNAMWNVVNLGIAAFGYFNAVNSDPASMTNLEILKDYNSLQSFLLLNAGLDAAYIMTGFYLKERSKNSSSAERLKGYGNSLLLQGGFLLLFDVTLYFIHQNNANINLYPHIESLLSGGVGVGINLKL